jgi:hypothetical protein
MSENDRLFEHYLAKIAIMTPKNEECYADFKFDTAGVKMPRKKVCRQITYAILKFSRFFTYFYLLPETFSELFFTHPKISKRSKIFCVFLYQL